MDCHSNRCELVEKEGVSKTSCATRQRSRGGGESRSTRGYGQGHEEGRGRQRIYTDAGWKNERAVGTRKKKRANQTVTQERGAGGCVRFPKQPVWTKGEKGEKVKRGKGGEGKNFWAQQ